MFLIGLFDVLPWCITLVYYLDVLTDSNSYASKIVVEFNDLEQLSKDNDKPLAHQREWSLDSAEKSQKAGKR